MILKEQPEIGSMSLEFPSVTAGWTMQPECTLHIFRMSRLGKQPRMAFTPKTRTCLDEPQSVLSESENK